MDRESHPGLEKNRKGLKQLLPEKELIAKSGH